MKFKIQFMYYDDLPGWLSEFNKLYSDSNADFKVSKVINDEVVFVELKCSSSDVSLVFDLGYFLSPKIAKKRLELQKKGIF